MSKIELTKNSQTQSENYFSSENMLYLFWQHIKMLV